MAADLEYKDASFQINFLTSRRVIQFMLYKSISGVLNVVLFN